MRAQKQKTKTQNACGIIWIPDLLAIIRNTIPFPDSVEMFNGAILVTADYMMQVRATRKKVPSIYLPFYLTFWGRIFRILGNIDHPLFHQLHHIDLRTMLRFVGQWKMPTDRSKIAAQQDITYLFR